MDGRSTNKMVTDSLQMAFSKERLKGSVKSSTVGAAATPSEDYSWALPSATEPLPASFYVVDRSELNQLIEENVRLRQDINSLLGKLSQLITLIRENYSDKAENLIVLREVPKRQAKKEIVQLFQKCGSLYYSDIAEQLRLDLELVVDLCSELEKEGKIKPKQ
ncbi:MAG: hypothetical protein KAX39_01515 [candidate division Zixibacteria bacterium]|nr:hypothetical protein [candidate division Zixibacteria bacterium]